MVWTFDITYLTCGEGEALLLRSARALPAGAEVVAGRSYMHRPGRDVVNAAVLTRGGSVTVTIMARGIPDRLTFVPVTTPYGPPGSPPPYPPPYPPSGPYPQHPQPHQHPAQYPQPQSAPYGAPQAPYPGGPYAPGHPPYPPRPPRKKPSLKWLWIALGAVVVLVVLVVISIVGSTARDIGAGNNQSVVDTTDDFVIGDCIQITAPAGKYQVDAVDCADTDFHFAVADKVSTDAECAGYSSYWTVNSAGDQVGDFLCLSAVYQPGRCYAEPEVPSQTALAEIREIDCGAGSPAGTIGFRVESTVAVDPQCPAGQAGVYRAKPTPVGYCLSPLG